MEQLRDCRLHRPVRNNADNYKKSLIIWQSKDLKLNVTEHV